MFHPLSKKLSAFSLCRQLLFSFAIYAVLLSESLPAATILVTSNDGSVGGDGTLYTALQQAQAGDTIDCSPIAGQTISLTTHLPAIGYSLTTATPSLTILGSGVTIDGGNTIPAFSLGQGSASITDFTIQNGLSQGGGGGNGKTGGGGGTGGGGALYVHAGSTMTISAISLNNNQAAGGAGGTGSTGSVGAGGGGFGGGRGGDGASTGANAGSGAGGGGNSGGTAGGRANNTHGGAGEPNTFTNFAGAGGGGTIPGITKAGAGGTNASIPATIGGLGGIGSVTHAAGGGGGGGSSGSGSEGSNAIDATPSGTGIGGAGGYGFGTGNSYGAGGGGGGGNAGGAGHGTSGGGGGLNGPGGAGGALGGGGGASGTNTGGNGGFGAGGGGGFTGGVDIYGIGGAGGSAAYAPAGGGGGSGLGGAIFVQKGAALVIQDNVSFSGNTTIAGMGGTATGAGSSNGGNGSSLGDDIFIQSGGAVTFQVNDRVTVSTPIQGAGLVSEATGPGVIKSGRGTINLTGANTYLGNTLIQLGTYNLNGSVNGDVHIVSGGTLSGNATVTGNIYNNGNISPGNSIGTVFTTNLYLYPTSVYDVQLNSVGDSDTITASGLAQIAGSVLVSPDDLNFTTPLTYPIITTGSGVTGRFSSLTSSTPSLMSLVYNPLTVELVYMPLNAIGLTGNALNAAQCFAALQGSDVTTINNVLLALPFDGIQTAFEQMSPAPFSGPTEVQLLDAILMRSIYTKRLQTYYFNKNLYCAQPISLWIDGIAQWQKQGGQFGYKDTTLGATIGVDYSTRNWILGLAFSSTYDFFHWRKSAGKANINSYYAGLYGLWNCNEFYMDMAFLGAFNKYKTTRQLSFGTVMRNAHAKHNGNEWLAHMGFEYRLCQSHVQLTPYINLDYVFLHEHCFTETGAGSLNLHVNSKRAMLFQGEAGIELSTTYATCNGMFIPMLTLGYINQTPCSSKDYHANFVNSTCAFTGKGGSYKRNLCVYRLALTYESFYDRINASLYYDGQVGSKYWAQDVVLNIMLQF